MKYTLSIDWLAFFCICDCGHFGHAQYQPDRTAVLDRWHYDKKHGEDKGSVFQSLPWVYKLEDHGTRQYRELWTISLNKEEVAQVQAEPCSSVLKSDSVIVKFHNRLLYQKELWDIVDRFLFDHHLTVQSVSRLDICADFNRFATMSAPELITGFVCSRLRHKGQGEGAAYFQAYNVHEGKRSTQHLKYTGLSFGTHKSDARVYLYNKTEELKNADKPWIRDLWLQGGLDVSKNVWRLEVSLKSKSTKFKDKNTDELYKVTSEKLHCQSELLTLYHTFVRKLFSFVHNRPGITNITREPVIKLFNDEPYMDRAVLRPVTGAGRIEKVIIKQLWQMSDKFRSPDILADEGVSKLLATTLAGACDLNRWFEMKKGSWKTLRK